MGLLAAGSKCRICVYPGPLSPGLLASPFCRTVLSQPLRLLGGGAGWALGGQVMSLLTPSKQAFRLNQNWLFILLNTLPYAGVKPVTFLLLIGFNWQTKFHLLLV